MISKLKWKYLSLIFAFILFSVLGQTESEAYHKAERFRHFVETSSHSHQPYAFTISGGVMQINPGDKLDEVFKRADERLYAAKEQGRNQIISEFYKTTRPGDKEV